MKISISRLKVLLTISLGVLFFGISMALPALSSCTKTSCAIDPNYSEEIKCAKPPTTDVGSNYNNDDISSYGDILQNYWVSFGWGLDDVVALQEKMFEFWKETWDCKLDCIDGRFGEWTTNNIDMQCIPCSIYSFTEVPDSWSCPATKKKVDDYSSYTSQGVDPNYTRSCCVSEEWETTAASTNNCKEYYYKGQTRECCGVLLNTDVPFVGKCIEFKDSGSTPLDAFPRLMWGLSKIMITLILVFSFMMVIAGGVMIASSWVNESGYWDGKKLIMKVVVGIALLWASGVILRLINPNFFW